MIVNCRVHTTAAVPDEKVALAGMSKLPSVEAPHRSKKPTAEILGPVFLKQLLELLIVSFLLSFLPILSEPLSFQRCCFPHTTRPHSYENAYGSGRVTDLRQPWQDER